MATALLSDAVAARLHFTFKGRTPKQKDRVLIPGPSSPAKK
jgi:hypothetical protein